MLIDLIRRFTPLLFRKRVGMYLFNQAMRSQFTLNVYTKILWGGTLEGLAFMPEEKVLIRYNGIPIILPAKRDLLWTAIEIFQDEVYDGVLSPQAGDSVIDVGANIGLFTVKASSKVGSGGLVIAIEPEPKNLSYLRLNTGELNNVKVLEKVALGREGTIDLFISGEMGCHSLIKTPHTTLQKIKVEGDTLDNIVSGLGLAKIDFIKIDVEGAELEVLKGAEEILRRGTKLSIAAYHTLQDGTAEFEIIKRFLIARGYKIVGNSNEYLYAMKRGI